MKIVLPWSLCLPLWEGHYNIKWISFESFVQKCNTRERIILRKKWGSISPKFRKYYFPLLSKMSNMRYSTLVKDFMVSSWDWTDSVNKIYYARWKGILINIKYQNASYKTNSTNTFSDGTKFDLLENKEKYFIRNTIKNCLFVKKSNLQSLVCNVWHCLTCFDVAFNIR